MTRLNKYSYFYILPWLFLSLAFRFLIPPNPKYGLVHDDELMVNLASQIINGNWLGSYETLGHLTLAKPPGYAIFLAATNPLPWAPTVSAHILLILGIFLIARELLILGVPLKGVALWTAFAAFTPAWFWDETSRIYRESLLLGLTSTVLGLSLLSSRLIRSACIDLNRRNLTKLSTALFLNGIFIGFFYITKPSWHAVLFVAIGVSSSYLFMAKQLDRKLRVIGIAFVLVCTITPALIAGKYIGQKNFETYGVRAIDSFGNGQFPRALNSIYSIEDTEDRKYVDVNAKMRAAMYSISDTASLLEPYLEGNPGEIWKGQPCQTKLNICDESGPWFAWELRDAVQSAGLGNSAIEFEETFRKIADDIDQACESQQIKCEQKGIAPGLDSIDSLGKRDLLDAISLSFVISANGEAGNSPREFSSVLTDERYKLWNETVKGLPENIELSSYEPNNPILGDTRKLASHPYTNMWLILLLVATFGVAVKIKSTPLGELANNLRWIAVFSAIGYAMYAGQIALLEASSGMYMTQGGSLYLIPAIYLQMIWLTFGILRLSIWWKVTYTRNGSQIVDY